MAEELPLAEIIDSSVRLCDESNKHFDQISTSAAMALTTPASHLNEQIESIGLIWRAKSHFLVFRIVPGVHASFESSWELLGYLLQLELLLAFQNGIEMNYFRLHF
jgi:hypothetical protein